MAKLGSSSRRPLLQGILLLAVLLLLASLQAGPVMAFEQALVDQFDKVWDQYHVGEKAWDYANKKVPTELGKRPGWKDGTDGWKAGYKTGKYAPVLGAVIQSGRTMTIDLTAAGGQGTPSF